MAVSVSSPSRLASDTPGVGPSGSRCSRVSDRAGTREEGVDLGSEPAEQADDRAGLRVAVEHRAVDGDDRPSAQRLGDGRQRRQVEEAQRGRHRLRGLGRPVGPAPQHALGVVTVPDEHAGIGRLDRVQPELDGRDDPEAAAASAQCPEELAVLRRVGAHVLAVRGDELDRGDAVAGEAELPRIPADSATEACSRRCPRRASCRAVRRGRGRPRARWRRARPPRPRRGRCGVPGRS